jgi:RHS repeat-associated protein
VAKTTQYDALGRPLTITTAAKGTLTYTYSANDVLVTASAPSGEHAKIHQYEYDGLGRVTSVCEVTVSLSGYANCQQAAANSGYLTKYSYDGLDRLLSITQLSNGATSQLRSFIYDGLGRMTVIVTPEGGTMRHVYDSDPSNTCSSHTGDLVKSTDNAGNISCYKYDALHRITNSTYPSGPDSSTTSPKSFVYDATTFICPNGANVIGRLAEVYTGLSGSKTTDEGCCYSKRGEVTDVYQSSPHSAGYTHLMLSYYENGELKSISGIPGLGTVTYAVDTYARPKAVTVGSQKRVNSITYTTAEMIGTLTYASGDSDVYGVNAYGNVSSFTHNVNGSAMKGVLAWNQNGTLGTLTITDALNTADTQSCAYKYDDLVRIASVNCGISIWQQNFTYDPFGNITKSVPSGSTGVNWAPGYKQSSNQYSLTGTSYDANGNLKSDTFNTYSWNADGTMSSSGATNYTYDAFGRVVEAGTIQYIYTPEGKLLASTSNSQSLIAAYVPIPGGGQAVYKNSAGTVMLDHFRRPDWIQSSRLMSTPSRTLYFDTAFAPFGEPYNSAGTADLAFAGMTQDISGNGNYVSPLRHYSAAQGRWVSPDSQTGNYYDPQRLNRYAYSRNTPLVLTDPTGADDSDWSSSDSNANDDGAFAFVDLFFNGNDPSDPSGPDGFSWFGPGNSWGNGDDFGGFSAVNGSFSAWIDTGQLSNPFTARNTSSEPGFWHQVAQTSGAAASYFSPLDSTITGPISEHVSAFLNMPEVKEINRSLSIELSIMPTGAVLALPEEGAALLAETAASVPTTTAMTVWEEWPPDQGFLGGYRASTTATPGELFSRIGRLGGRYVSPIGTSLGQRGLAAWYSPATESTWEVVNPFTMEGGIAAPWKGAPGLGVQYRLPQSVESLWRSGYIKPVK